MNAPKENWCQVCGERASYGFGRDLRRPLYWTCRQHREDGEAMLAQLAPAAIDPASPAPTGSQGVLL